MESDRLLSLQCDLRDPASVLGAAAAAKETPLLIRRGLTHVMVSAGVISVNMDPDVDFNIVSQKEMMDVYAVNAIGPVLVIQAFLSLMAEPQGQTLPIFSILSSKVGSVSDNGSGGLFAYRAPKSAVNNIAKSLEV
ncbi:hypothetical protein T484DRAFT_3155744 [Baffinella frigidus]|nr:hypothetical protein T484DRAFT_3155744 [Cryptophyta sp. CCMP2293]